jgi:hypothetical protein
VNFCPEAGKIVFEIIHVAVLVEPTVVEVQSVVVLLLLKSDVDAPLKPTCLVTEALTYGKS